MASENSDPSKRRRGGFQPGISGNPGGRPKGSKDFRQRCRSAASELLKGIEEAIEDGSIKAWHPAVRLEALQVLADRGGFLSADREMGALLKVLALQNLSEEQRSKVLAGWTEMITERPALNA